MSHRYHKFHNLYIFRILNLCWGVSLQCQIRMPEISVILLPWYVIGISHFSYSNASMSLKTSPRENMLSSLKSVLLIVAFLSIFKLHCNAEQSRTHNKQENHVMKTGFSCRRIFSLQQGKSCKDCRITLFSSQDFSSQYMLMQKGGDPKSLKKAIIKNLDGLYCKTKE